MVRPVFIIGSGRSGTRSMYKLLRTCPEIEVHHEYLCEYIQPLGVLRFANRITSNEVVESLKQAHGAAVSLSKQEIWIDASNKLTWLVPELLTIFPDALFVNIVRDGRKVAGSYYRKLPHEIYDDRSVELLKSWLHDPYHNIKPPPEKRYWWNIPTNGQPFADDFGGFDQFERCVYHWVESNRVAKFACDNLIPNTQSLTLKLEDLTTSIETQKNLMSFIGVPFRQEFSNLLHRPENVIVPLDLKLNAKQAQQFATIGSNMMEVLGYSVDSEEYRVDYR